MINCLWFGLLFLLFFGTRPDQTALPLFGVLDWVAPAPVRIDRCVVDRDAVERGDLFPGVMFPEIDVSYVKLISP